MNRITIIGHLGNDPEVRRLENGTPVSKFGVATNESYKDAKDEWQTTTEWHEVVVWRQLAERAEKTLKKGSMVFIEGKMTYRKYTDKNGVERTSSEIVASNLQVIEKMPSRGETNFPSEGQAPPAYQQRKATPEMETAGHKVAFEVVAPPSNDGAMPENKEDLPF